jgi:hypothetical protein
MPPSVEGSAAQELYTDMTAIRGINFELLAGAFIAAKKVYSGIMPDTSQSCEKMASDLTTASWGAAVKYTIVRSGSRKAIIHLTGLWEFHKHCSQGHHHVRLLSHQRIYGLGCLRLLSLDLEV